MQLATRALHPARNRAAEQALPTRGSPQATVPYCFVGGEFLGGCDAVAKLASRGELAPKVLAAAAAAGGTSPAPVGASHVRSGCKASASAGGTSEEEGSPSAGKGGRAADKAAAELSATCHDGPLPYMPDCGFADPHCKPALGEETPRAYPCLFWFPEVVDGNVIRLTAAQVGTPPSAAPRLSGRHVRLCGRVDLP